MPTLSLPMVIGAGGVLLVLAGLIAMGYGLARWRLSARARATWVASEKYFPSDQDRPAR